MKITKEKLNKIIKEEIKAVIDEGFKDPQRVNNEKK